MTASSAPQGRDRAAGFYHEPAAFSSILERQIRHQDAEFNVCAGERDGRDGDAVKSHTLTACRRRGTQLPADQSPLPFAKKLLVRTATSVRFLALSFFMMLRTCTFTVPSRM